MVFRVPPSESEITPERMLPIVKWIRFASGQSTIGDMLGGQFVDDSLVGHGLNFFAEGVDEMAVLPHVELTAISHDLLLGTRAEGVQSGDVPVYADILLDAIESDFRGDYMKAVLYSAIAIECVAATRLDEEYRLAQAPTRGQPSSSSVAPTSGENERRYADLRKRARTSFRILLHDLPEVVLRRSLLREDSALHREIFALRDIRNGFVHAGISPGPVQAYGLAKKAFATALRTFAWFQAEGRFVTKHGQRYGAG